VPSEAGMLVSDNSLLQPALSEEHVRARHFIITALIGGAMAVLLLGGCAAQSPLAARVVDDVRVIEAPPVADLDRFSRVASAAVGVGDRVAAGDVLVVFDPAALQAAFEGAKADRAVAKAQVGVIDGALDEIASGRSELADARQELASARSKLSKTRAELVAKRAELKKLLAQMERAGAGHPPGSTPGTLPPGVTPPSAPNPAELRAALAQLDAGIDRLDAGLAKAKSGESRLAAARGRLANAKSQLEDARDLALIAADASAVSVRLAQWRLDEATVRSPYDGVVVSALSPGDVVAPGATVATIRMDGPSRLTTWLTPLEAATLERRLRAPQSADRPKVSVEADWLAPGVALPGSITRIGTRAVYPPTSFATKEVHLTRAVLLEVTVDSTQTALPPGAPADVWIR